MGISRCAEISSSSQHRPRAVEATSVAPVSREPLLLYCKEAADVAQANCDRANEVVRKLSDEMHAAEDRERQLPN